MAIRIEELNPLACERELASEYVIFEIADKPSSRTGDGKPHGILKLTNKRLFYISIKEGRSTIGKAAKVGTTGLKVVTHIGTHIANHFTFGLASTATGFMEYGIKKGFENLEREKLNDIMVHLGKEESFVMPVQSIAKSEKIEEKAKSFFKAREFVRIGIESEDGMIHNYCIYKIDEKGNTIADGVLFGEICALGKDTLCEACGEANSMRLNFCVFCGNSINKSLNLIT